VEEFIEPEVVEEVDDGEVLERVLPDVVLVGD
jgi:hypothetical protein